MAKATGLVGLDGLPIVSGKPINPDNGEASPLFNPGQIGGGLNVKVTLLAFHLAQMNRMVKDGKMKDPNEIAMIGFTKELELLYKNSYPKDADMTPAEMEKNFNEFVGEAQAEARKHQTANPG